MNKGSQISDKTIAVAVAAALAEQTAEIASAIAKQTADDAIAVAKVATEAATAVANKVSMVASDITYIKDEVTSLTTKMDLGFKNITDRQDVTNGKVLKHEESFIRMEAKATGSNNFGKLAWFILTPMVSVLTALIMYLLTAKF